MQATNPVTTTPGGTNGGGHIGGPILGGVTPPQSGPAPSPGLSTIPGVPAAPSPGATGGLPGVMSPGVVPPPAPTGSLPATGGRIGQGNVGKPGSMLPTNGRAMPSGGVIGAKPGSGVIGQIPSGSAAPRGNPPARPNPVGGVIGQTGSTPASKGMATRNGPGSPRAHQPGLMTGQLGQNRRHRGEVADNATWDPDNPWETDQGVDPIVLPPEDPGPIDPGPAIGYRR